MEDLILTMMVTLQKYGETLGYTKQDIDNIATKSGLIDELKTKNPECNERGIILFYQNNYIDAKKFSDILSSYSVHVEIIEDKLYLIASGYNDILNEKEYSTEIEIMKGEFDNHNQSYYDVGLEYYISDYDNDTLEAIIDYCIKEGLEIDGVSITTENISIVDGTIYFNDEEFFDYIDDDDLEDLKHELTWAVIEAQSDADMSDVYDSLISSFEEKVGTTEWKDEKLYIKLNITLNEISDMLKEYYGDYDFENEYYGSLYDILKENEIFDIDTPDYNNVSGTIDKSYLNENTQSKLGV